MGMRRALCVGIDQYPFDPLTGCVGDAQRMATVLSKNDDGSPNFDCRVLVAPLGQGDDTVTRAAMKRELRELLAYPAEIALLQFSGHGTVNDLDGYLVTQDAAAYDEGLAMSEVLKMANDSKAEEVVILLDCCHSGRLGNPPVIDNAKALLREGVAILTASRCEQVSVEVGGGGLFTSLVLDALEGGACDIRGEVTAPAIYAFVEAALGAWDQRPLFKSHLSKVVPLRRCDAKVDLSVVRALPELFPVPAEDLSLSPAFEPSSGQADPHKTACFAKLQALSRVHLVVPVDAPHMYDAAVQSKGCRLTASGRYYWRLAKSNRI